MKRLTLALITATTLCAALPASAQFRKPEDAIKYRQAAMTVMGAHMGRLAAMAQGRVPYDAKAAADNASVLATVSRLPFAAFGEGTDKGRTHRAKPEVWTDAPKFKEATDKLFAELGKLEAAGKSGSLDQLKAALGPVGAACKGCHDSFQAD